MKIIVLISILTISFASIGQQKQTDTTHIRTLKGDAISSFIDSLKVTILQDTSKFNRPDLLHTNMGTRNTKSYSPAYFVDMKYSYKLDIINGTLVKEFEENILDASKIASIDIVDTTYSRALFGVNGMNGAILINTKRKAKMNFKVAGLKLAKDKKHGDNFNQRQGSEVKILY
ncbi:MAG: hypothetical protein WAU24_06945 [Chitinophagaceae bacterium]